MLTQNQLKAYFTKIGFNEMTEETKLEPTLELLNKLHELHVFSIPFENLSIHLNEEINIDVDSIFNKLVNENRGGYCYEMNGLFYSVLKTLGFNVKLHLALVTGTKKATHAMLIVNVDGKDYLADVGFGRNGLIHPLAFSTESSKQKQVYSTMFEIQPDNSDYIYGIYINGEFTPEYRFDLPKNELALSDLQEYSNFVSKNPESLFTKMILVTKPTKEGRLTLHNNILKNLNGSSPTKNIIDNYDAYKTMLKTSFEISFAGKLSFKNIPVQETIGLRQNSFFKSYPELNVVTSNVPDLPMMKQAA